MARYWGGVMTTNLPVESPEAMMRVWLALHVEQHAKGQELLAKQFDVDPADPEWFQIETAYQATNSAAVEAQVELKDAMLAAKTSRFEHGGWRATLLPLGGTKYAIYARVEPIGGAQ